MYVDTSVLTKLFIHEPDSESWGDRIGGATLVSSELAYGELWAAFLRKERAGSISARDRDISWFEFEARIREESICLLRLDYATVREARQVMLHVHPKVALRTLDAIHLATYQSVFAGSLLTADTRMREAATLLGIQVA